MAIKGLLHRFGFKTKARELELNQRLVECQAAYAALVKDMHELHQFAIMKIVVCTSRLDSLDHEIRNYRTRDAQVAIGFEELEK